MEVIEKLSYSSGQKVKIIETQPAHGGSINNSVFLNTTAGKFFLKTNSAVRFPGMFDCESKGIELLRKTNAVSLPAVIHTGAVNGTGYLLLDMVEKAPRASNYWVKAGESLALLHKSKNKYFGLDHNNYIGSLRQSNTINESGVDFMITERFEPMLRIAHQKKLINENEMLIFEKFLTRLSELLPEESPSLLHGDLWNGNVITGPDGQAWLIDPAVYYGYRETDLAMARLFGGFDQEFFDSYQDTYPLYLYDVKRILKKYG